MLEDLCENNSHEGIRGQQKIEVYGENALERKCQKPAVQQTTEEEEVHKTIDYMNRFILVVVSNYVSVGLVFKDSCECFMLSLAVLLRLFYVDHITRQYSTIRDL